MAIPPIPFGEPVNTTLLRRAISILFSATLIVSFIPAQGFAEPADMTGSNLDSATSSSAQLTGGNSSDASINASEESVQEDSSTYGEAGTPMFANGDVGVFLLAILTLRGLMRLHSQQMPRLPSLISLRRMLLEPLIRRCIPRCSTRTERL